MESTNLDFLTRSGRAYKITPEKIQQWQKTFPGLDVPLQLRLAWQWNEDNPDQRKMHQHVPRFLFSWLNRSYSKMKPEKNGPSYSVPYRKKTSTNFLGMLRRRYTGRSPKTDSQLLIEHFQAELKTCRQCDMSHDLIDLRGRLGRYLWLEIGMDQPSAEKLAIESLPLEL